MHEPSVNMSDKLTTQATATASPSWLYGPTDVSTRRPRDTTERRAVGLGWLSVGLGLVQLVAPRGIARLIGASDSVFARATMRAVGLRELSTGVGILMQPRPNALLWARVAGDLVDLGLLTAQFATSKHGTARLGLATVAVAGVAALDAKAALDVTRARRGEDPEAKGVEVAHSITINAPPEEVYKFWRTLENLPKFLEHLESVTVQDGKSIWRAKAPLGTTVEWEAKVTNDEPNSLIQWSSLPGSTIPNHGSVRFKPAPGNRGTEVHVALTYEPPSGAFAAIVAKLFGEEPKQQIKSDLRRLKQVLETGEVVQSDSSIHRGAHPAQPSSDAHTLPQTYEAPGKATDAKSKPAPKTPSPPANTTHTPTSPIKPVGREVTSSGNGGTAKEHAAKEPIASNPTATNYINPKDDNAS